MKLKYITPECEVRSFRSGIMLATMSGGDTHITGSPYENDDVDDDGFTFSN